MLTFFCIVTFSLAIQSCYTLKQAGTPVEEEIEITNYDNLTPANHFVKTKKVSHFVYGLVSPDNVAVEKIISDALKTYGGTKAVNVRISYQMTAVDGVVSLFTFGIYTPFTLTVEGDVVP